MSDLDLVATLAVDHSEWATGFSEANAVLDDFAAGAVGTTTRIADNSRKIGTVATTAAISVGSLAVGLMAVGGSAGGLFAVAGSLFGISRASNLASTSIKGLQSGTSYVQKLTGIIGTVGAAATLSALSLRGISYVMASYGKDTAKVDALAKTIGRIGLAASVAVIGIKGIGFAVSTMRATAGLGIAAVTKSFSALSAVVATVPAGIIKVGGALRSIGSAGVGAIRSGASAFGSFAATAGDALGQVGQGIATVATGFAVGGIVGGIATVAGLALSANGAFAELFASSTAASAPLRNIAEWLQGIRDWLGEIGSKVASGGLSLLGEMAQRGQKYFESFLQAVQPLTDAIQNVWLPAVLASTDGANSAFAGFFDFIEETFGTWVFDSIELLSEFVGNFDLYFQIAQQTIALWASNGMLQVQDFFKNLGTWLDWFGENWSDVLFSASDLAMTVFINIGENLKSIFSEIWDWVKGGFTGELDIDWTPLTKGFHSTIKEWPKLVNQELADTSPELESLFDDLGKRQADAKARGQTITKGTLPDATDEKSGKATAVKEMKTPDLKAAFAGSQEAASIMLRGVGGKSMEAIANKQLTVQQQTLVAVKDMKPKPMKAASLGT